MEIFNVANENMLKMLHTSTITIDKKREYILK